MKALITAKIKLLFSPLLLLLLITVFVFTSCENSIRNNITADEENKTEHVITSKNPESGSIKININNLKSSQKNGRTVLPDIDTDNIVSLSLSGSQGTSTKNFGSWTSVTALTSETIELKKGDWNLTLTAQLDNGASFIATSPVTVTGTETQTVNFSLSTTATKGGVYLKVSYTGNVQVARYQLYKYTGTTSSTTPLENGNLTVNTSAGNVVFERPATGTTALAQGNYRILINFYGDADGTIFLNSYSEIIRIKGGFTSKADDRTIDLNSMYSITYMNGGTTPTPISGTPVSGSLVENYSARSSTIALPEMERSGYDFAGWFSNSACTGTPETEFSITSSTSLGNKTFYAKWTRVCAITYYIAAEGFTSESECIELTEDQCDEWGLSQSHTAGSATQLPLSPVVNENSIPITLAGYTLSSLSGTALTSNGSYYLIPASVSTDTSIYLHVKSHLSYIDPVKGDDKNLAFNPSTPAQTIAGAKKWLKNADSSKNPVLYVKSAISNKNDIENLSDLSSPAASGGLYGAAIVKRHSSFTNGSLLSITENLTLKNVTLDGGAIWSKTQTEIEADPELLVTRTNSGLSSSIYLISTGNATFEGVTIQNVDNTATTNNGNGAAVYINSGTLTLTNCHIKDCRSIRGALFATTAGKINAKNTRFLCNNSIGSGSDKGHGGAVYLYGGTTSGGQAIFDACSFQYNAANAFGGAVYVGNNAKATFKNQGSNSLANNFSDMATAAASRTCKGDFVYTRGTLTLLGDFVFGTGANALSFYIDNASSQHPISLGDNFGGDSTTGNAKIYLAKSLEDSLDQAVLKQATGDTSVNIANAKIKFALAENDGNYLIDDNGYIKLIPGTVTGTPGFPGNYVCQWKQRVSGTTRYIDLIIEDLEEHALEIGTAVGNINSVTAGIYEGADLVKEYTLTSATGLSFAYPSYLDPPSGTPFYVKFNVKVDDTTAYSYDYWPEQIWMGSKTPDQAKNVGDIVFNDGSAEPYVEGMTISDEQKAAAIALIFYKGTDLNSDNDNGSPDTTTLRTLGVGLKHNSLAWCTSSAAAYNNNITTIQCTIDGSVGSFTFTGDKNGSDNLEQIAAFLANENDTGVGLNSTKTEAEAADLYPAFYFARNYKNFPGSNVGGTDFENNWYLPSLPELYQIYANGKGTGKVFDIDAVSQALGGDQFGSDVVQYYRPSTQSSSFSDETRIQNFGDGDYGNHSKLSILSLCCIREF